MVKNLSEGAYALRISKKEKVLEFICCYLGNHVGLGKKLDIDDSIPSEDRPDISLKYENTTYFIDTILAGGAGTIYKAVHLHAATDRAFEVGATAAICLALGYVGSMLMVNGSHYIKDKISDFRENYKKKSDMKT
jgi:hypothetical protein